MERALPRDRTAEVGTGLNATAEAARAAKRIARKEFMVTFYFDNDN
jgi:hypothetical protein